MPEQGRDGTTRRDGWITQDHRRLAIAALIKISRKRTGDQRRVLNAHQLGLLAKVPRGHSDNPVTTREYIRRRCRELVADLRERGWPIVATKSPAGYHLADEVAEFEGYRKHQEREARRKLARVAAFRRSQAATDAAGQFTMFDTTPAGGPTHRY